MSSTPGTDALRPDNPAVISAVVDDLRRVQRRVQSLEDDVAHLVAVVDAHADLLHSIGVLTSEHGARFDPQ